jgi:hypothetical protein
MPEYDTTTATRSRWRNPVFLGIFVPGGLAWLAVVGWLTWMYVNPVMAWLGGLNAILQEIVGTAVVLVWAVFFAFGLAAVGTLAERVAGLPPSGATPGQTAGKHAGWKPPKRS